MVGIIWFVVVLYIVIRCVNSGKKKRGQTKPNVPRKAAPAKRQNTGRTAGKWSNPQPQPPKKENSILQRAKANTAEQFNSDTLKARGASDPYRVPDKEGILRDEKRAHHIHSEHDSGHGAELRNQPGVDDFDTWHLMDEVNDLIVKGYSGHLEFSRDFMAEATDMLNRMYG